MEGEEAEDEEDEGGGRRRSVRGAGLKLLAVGGIVSLGLILNVLQCLFVLFFT